MGLFATRWEATHEGHAVVVNRNEWTKGFSLEWDGVEIARRRWSLIGLGKLHGSAEMGGKPVEVNVEIRWGGHSRPDKGCSITVDGVDLAVEFVK